MALCRSREGARIEIMVLKTLLFMEKVVAPARECGLKLISAKLSACRGAYVAPARERGLKFSHIL